MASTAHPTDAKSERCLVALEGVSMRYQDALVFEEASFRVDRAERIAVQGVSGSGKSTLLAMLCGDVRSQGHRTTLPGLRVGLMQQHPIFIEELTVFENLLLPQLGERMPHVASKTARQVWEVTSNRATDLLGRVGLNGQGGRYPHQLSVGMRARLALVRSLILGPDLLLLDEPTAALDSENALGLMRLVSDLQAAAGFAFVLSTHDAALLRFVDQSYRIVSRRLVRDIG